MSVNPIRCYRRLSIVALFPYSKIREIAGCDSFTCMGANATKAVCGLVTLVPCFPFDIVERVELLRFERLKSCGVRDCSEWETGSKRTLKDGGMGEAGEDQQTDERMRMLDVHRSPCSNAVSLNEGPASP